MIKDRNSKERNRTRLDRTRLLTFNNVDATEKISALLCRERDYHSSTMHCLSLSRLEKSPIPKTRWRPKIIEWFYNIVDHFELNRDIVAIALDLLDRFHIFSNEKKNYGESYQLAAMTTLYIAIKINYTSTPVQNKAFALNDYAKLSRGQFLAQDILSMELHLLKHLRWKVNPVIPTDYLIELLSLLNNQPPKDDTSKICTSSHHMQYVLTILYEVARYLIEVTITSPDLHFYLNSFQVQSPRILCLGVVRQTLDWVSNHHISLCVKNDFTTKALS